MHNRVKQEVAIQFRLKHPSVLEVSKPSDVTKIIMYRAVVAYVTHNKRSNT